MGAVFYFYIEDRYFKLKLIKKSDELKEIKEKKIKEETKCPAHFAGHNNECRYNVHTKRFTCQFNPKHLKNSGYFYNSPDVCCNNRCEELNKILDVVIENRDKPPEGTQKVWCQINSGMTCKVYNSPDGNCPNDAMTNQSMPSFGSKNECEGFGKRTVCLDRDRENCLGSSGCVWLNDDDDNVNGGKCVVGTPSGPYYTRTNASVGYINGPPTAKAGNTNPFFMVSSFMKGGKNYKETDE